MKAFLAFILAACQSMGIETLPVAVDAKVSTERNNWAETCNHCEPRMWRISEELLEYGDAEFLRVVAYHEACHVYLGHDKDWVDLHGAIAAEIPIPICIQTFAQLTPARLQEITDKANAWARVRRWEEIDSAR